MRVEPQHAEARAVPEPGDAERHVLDPAVAADGEHRTFRRFEREELRRAVGDQRFPVRDSVHSGRFRARDRHLVHVLPEHLTREARECAASAGSPAEFGTSEPRRCGTALMSIGPT